MKIIFTTNKSYTDSDILLLHFNSSFTANDIDSIVDSRLEILETSDDLYKVLKQTFISERSYSDKELLLISQYYFTFSWITKHQVIVLSPSIIESELEIVYVKPNEFKGTLNPYSLLKISYDRKKSRYIIPNLSPTYNEYGLKLKHIQKQINE